MLSKVHKEQHLDQYLTLRTNSNSGGGSPPLAGLVVPEPATLIQRTDAVCAGLDLLLEHHAASNLIREELKSQLHSYLDVSGDELVWLARVKYVYTYPLAKYLRNEPPPPPDCVFKPAGKLRGWMKSRLNTDVKFKNVHLWYSWFQSKRSTLPLSEDVIDQTYEKHLSTLTKVDKGVDETIKSVFRNTAFLKVLSDVRYEMFKSLDGKAPLEMFPTLMPSGSACFEASRAQMGQRNLLRHAVGLNMYPEDPDQWYIPDTVPDNPYPVLLEKEMSARMARGNYTLPEHLSELQHNWQEKGFERMALAVPATLRLPASELHSILFRPWVYSRMGRIINAHIFRTCSSGIEDWSSLTEITRTFLTKIGRPNLNCTIQAVLEPNKVRVISKGEAIPYYSCRPLQRALHSALRSMNPFRLIGRPFCPTDMVGLAKKAQPDWEWFSVDYSAATDNLSWKYSGLIFDHLIKGLPSQFYDLASAVLGPHNLYYPSRGGRGGKPVFKGVMQNGQLMGSILSFPILCLANLGVYLLATEDTQRGWSVNERLDHVLVNGDDMIYASPPSDWDRHVSVAKDVGLDMSVGKAYRHREYANINSTSVLLPLHKGDRLKQHPVQVNYLNTGLFFGLHKVQGKSETAQEHSRQAASDRLVVNCNTLLRGSLPGKEDLLLKRFLKEHKDKIGQEIKAKTFNNRYYNRNLFIPESLGGMGVTPPVGWKFKVTKMDLYVAEGYVKMYPNLEYCQQRPICCRTGSIGPGFDISLTENSVPMPWDIPASRSDELPRVPYKGISYPLLRRLCRSDGIIHVAPYRDALMVMGKTLDTASGNALCAGPQGDSPLVAPSVSGIRPKSRRSWHDSFVAQLTERICNIRSQVWRRMEVNLNLLSCLPFFD